MLVRAFFWPRVMKQLGLLAKRMKWALKRLANTDREMSAEKDKHPGLG
jgi:hypothetical protein